MTEIPTDNNIFNNINNSYYYFTASEKKVADFVMAKKMDIQFMSISELADACGVADATISRFCRRLELRGYNAFKLAIAKEMAREAVSATVSTDSIESDLQYTDDVLELCHTLYGEHTQAISQTMAHINPDNIRKAAQLLVSAKKVFCMGQGGSMIMAQEATHLFSTVSPKFFNIMDSHLQASTAALLSEEDVLMFFSYSGSTKDIVDIMALAKEHGAKVILITRFARSPGADYADVVLQCVSNEGPLQLGTVAARMAQLFLIDVLYQQFCQHDLEGARICRERIASALADKHL